jgi:uncharacterized protein YjbI with pentapeptide repeats
MLVLSEGSLHCANLTDANLTGACLRRTDTIRSNLTNACLLGVDIEGASFEDNIYRNTTWIDGSIRND